MKKLVFTALFICTFKLFAQTPVITEAIPIEQIVAELKNSEKESEAQQKLPYPIIFIHGLNGDFDTWSDVSSHLIQEGFIYGGQLPYCLNSDNDAWFSNIYSQQTTDIASFVGISPLEAGDFYIINFDVNPDGEIFGGGWWQTNNVHSNQAAIVKQGAALKFAIKAVTQITGRDKVILFGHSMGGLAARAYLQSQNFWQEDGEHHVAKLITSGTPHGGSNLWAGVLSGIFGIDEQSDAVRDLRNSYASGSPGVFLFGGYQNSTVLNNGLFQYYSFDVDCDGGTGDFFEGINDRPIPPDFDIAFMVANDGLDFVVPDYQENFSNYFPNHHAEAFQVECDHLDMPKQTAENVLLLDEPDDYDLAYNIAKNTEYTAFFTEQSSGSNWPDYDYDDFRFTMPQNGFVKLIANNVPSNNAECYIYRASDLQLLAVAEAGNSASMATTLTWLTAGDYYAELVAEPSSASWQHPYTFEVQASGGASPSSEPAWLESASISPNPTQGKVSFVATFPAYTEGLLSITDALGRAIQICQFSGDSVSADFDLEYQPSGVYFINLRFAEGVRSWTVVKE